MPAAAIPDQEKASVRAVVFDHLSGVALAPTVKALADRKVFELFAGQDSKVTLDEVVNWTGGNRGYLRVAMRLLASAGWLQQTIGEDGRNQTYSLTAEEKATLTIAQPRYGEVISFVHKTIFLEDFLFVTSVELLLTSLRY